MESVEIASGLLLAAIHNSGLVSLTHTPSPMDFLRLAILKEGTMVPYIHRKSQNETVERR
jgi:iodotyrosine deiodinase